MNNPHSDWHDTTATQAHRNQQNNHQPAVLWLTGLPGSGKSTLAYAIEEKLYHIGCRTKVLDGDNMRHGLCQDLGFSDADRRENVRRVAEVSQLFVEAGNIVLSALISPFDVDRKQARTIINTDHFIEVYCHCQLDVCEQRDPKGLYQLARAGKIDNFTGISSPYEPPKNPEIILHTQTQSLAECVTQVIAILHKMGIINSID